MIQFTANLSLLFTELDLIDRFKAAKKCGFNAVEIQFPYSLPATKIEQALIENQLKLVLFNINADDLLLGGEGVASVPGKQEYFLNALQQCKSYAEALQPEAINVLPGRCVDQRKKTEYLTTFKNNLIHTLETFTPLGIKTVFEAINTIDMPNAIIHTEQQMLGILDQINHPMLYMQYDIYHMQMMGEKTLQFFKKYGHKIGHIQFADMPGRGQPGTGKINFHQLFTSLENSTYSGWVGAEYNPIGTTEQSLNWMYEFN
ncbi:MAG: TIM barrel protein [Methylococcales bacterium]|nr:TIM barrel protein [Methylococcales bacterium]